MKKRIQVFISSTYADLLKERQASVSAILKAGHIPAGMELFAAEDESQIKTIRRWIAESDVFMLILGSRYGSIEPTTGKSYIELEYDYAVTRKKPLFAVVMDEKTLKKRARTSPNTATADKEGSDQYQALRKKVLSKTCSFFSNPKDVQLAVHESLGTLQGRYQFSGWVAGPEVDSLRRKVETLEQELHQSRSESDSLRNNLNPDSTRDTHTAEMRELASILDRIQIETTAIKAILNARRTKNTVPDSVSLLDAFSWFRDTLTTGITNKRGMLPLQRFMYFDLSPRLEPHGILKNEPIAGHTYRRYVLTEKGLRLLAYMDKLSVGDSTEHGDTLGFYEQQKHNWKYYVQLELVGVSLVVSASPVINFTFELQNYLPIELTLLKVIHSSGTVSAGALGSCALPALSEGIEQRVDRATKRQFTITSGICGPSVVDFLERVSTKGQLLQWSLTGEWYVDAYGKIAVWAYRGHPIQYDQVVK